MNDGIGKGSNCERYSIVGRGMHGTIKMPVEESVHHAQYLVSMPVCSQYARKKKHARFCFMLAIVLYATPRVSHFYLFPFHHRKNSCLSLSIAEKRNGRKHAGVPNHGSNHKCQMFYECNTTINHHGQRAEQTKKYHSTCCCLSCQPAYKPKQMDLDIVSRVRE